MIALIEIFAYAAITYAVLVLALSGLLNLILTMISWLWDSVPSW